MGSSLLALVMGAGAGAGSLRTTGAFIAAMARAETRIEHRDRAADGAEDEAADVGGGAVMVVIGLVSGWEVS